MTKSPYRKDWYVRTGIARGMIGIEPESRIPTIIEYTKIFDSSRGLVQNALEALQQAKAIVLDKRGKQGTYLLQKDNKTLFKQAGLQFITGSMPAPLTMHLAGLATAICQAMNDCYVPFTFAFVQGSENRVDALLREIYDFVVVTRSSAIEYIEQNSDLAIAFPLKGCNYSHPYTLYINKPHAHELEDGMTIAVDRRSADQWKLTQQLCEGKEIEQVEMSYISCNYALLTGAVNSAVLQGELNETQPNLHTMFAPTMNRLDNSSISAIPLTDEPDSDYQQPVILYNKNNYGIDSVLEMFLADESLAKIQKMVLDLKMPPQFY